MAFIKMISDDEATPELKELYDAHKAPWGGVDHILKIHGLLPSTLKPHVDLYRTLMFGKGPLSRQQREMIATVVSQTNSCTYCVHHHSDGLLRVTRDKQFAEMIRTNFREANLTEADKNMLEFAALLTSKPHANFAETITKMKDVGIAEDAILHITLIVGYFNFVNRIAIGLGVELEDYWSEDGYSDPDKKMAHDE